MPASGFRGERTVMSHHHQSLNRECRWGTTDDFATSFLHFSLFSTALWDLPNSRPVSLPGVMSTSGRPQGWEPIGAGCCPSTVKTTVTVDTHGACLWSLRSDRMKAWREGRQRSKVINSTTSFIIKNVLTHPFFFFFKF